jgi:hypothetical protein
MLKNVEENGSYFWGSFPSLYKKPEPSLQGNSKIGKELRNIDTKHKSQHPLFPPTV